MERSGVEHNGMEWNGAERNEYSIPLFGYFRYKVDGTEHILNILFHLYPCLKNTITHE
jgi:hypothetical protein